MNSNIPQPKAPRALPLVPILLCAIALLPMLLVVGVFSFFQLSGDASALRASALESLPGTWKSKVALHAGFFTTTLVRLGSSFFKLPPEAQMGIASLRGAEVSVCKSQGTDGWVDSGVVLAHADKAMSARRWDRAIGVSREGELVAVYVPRGGAFVEHASCCVLVLHRGELVVAGVSGNLGPVLELAQQHLNLSGDLASQFHGFGPRHKFLTSAGRRRNAPSLRSAGLPPASPGGVPPPDPLL